MAVTPIIKTDKLAITKTMIECIFMTLGTLVFKAHLQASSFTLFWYRNKQMAKATVKGIVTILNTLLFTNLINVFLPSKTANSMRTKIRT